jgi:serine/threonine protein kinase
MAPAIAGCADSLAGERGINLFGPAIVRRWLEWMRGQPPGLRLSAISELADLPAARARQEAVAAVEPATPAEDRTAASEYLAALPRMAQRALVLDQSSGAMILPPGQAPDDPRVLLNLLPADVPPCPPHAPLAGTPYHLGDLLSIGDFAVYRATHAAQPNHPVALKVCRDRSLADLLRQQRPKLERLRDAGRGNWDDRLVRLCDFDLDHAPPFLVCDPVSGDLAALLSNLRQQTGRGFAPDEVFDLMRQLVEVLASAHRLGLVHGGLTPASVLVSGTDLKLTDLDTGAALAGHALRHSRIGASPFEQLSPAEQVGLLRGAGTALYLSPEQRRGDRPDPRQDLYSLGVIWYQLLLGDLTRAAAPGWAEELRDPLRVPPLQVALIERCLGAAGRPQAEELRELMREDKPKPPPRHHPAPTAMSPEEVRATRLRQQGLLAELKALQSAHEEWRKEQMRSIPLAVVVIAAGGVVAVAAEVLAETLGRLAFLTSPLGLVILTISLAAVLALLVSLKNRRRRLDSRQAALAARAQRLAADYPEEVLAWGGEHVLHNAALLHEIVAAVTEETPAD